MTLATIEVQRKIITKTMQTSVITIDDINCPNGDNSPKEAGDTRLPASMPTRHSQGAACSCPILYKSNDNSAKMKIENILQSGSDGKQSYLSKADIPLIEISEHQALEVRKYYNIFQFFYSINT